MLNQSGITTKTAVTPKSILWAPENAIAFSCVVAKSKKLLAGTPIAGDLTARNTGFTVAQTTSGASGASGASDAVGLLLHEVDASGAKQNGTVLVAGVVDLNKLDSTTQALITTEVKAALKHIIFVK